MWSVILKRGERVRRLALIVFVILFIAVSCKQETLQGAATKETVQSERTPAIIHEIEPPKEGRLVLFLNAEAFDKDAKSAEGKLTVLEVSAFHKELGFWTKISSVDTVLKTGDKAQASSVYATATIREGMYEQLRVKINEVIVMKNGSELSLTLPAQELKIPFPFEISSDAEKIISIHFLFEKSLYKKGEVFAPVVEVVSGLKKQEFFMNAKGIMGAEKFDLKKFEEKEKVPVVQKEKTEEEKRNAVSEQEARRASLDAAVIKISPGEKKKLVMNRQ